MGEVKTLKKRLLDMSLCSQNFCLKIDKYQIKLFWKDK